MIIIKVLITVLLVCSYFIIQHLYTHDDKIDRLEIAIALLINELEHKKEGVENVHNDNKN